MTIFAVQLAGGRRPLRFRAKARAGDEPLRSRSIRAAPIRAGQTPSGRAPWKLRSHGRVGSGAQQRNAGRVRARIGCLGCAPGCAGWGLLSPPSSALVSPTALTRSIPTKRRSCAASARSRRTPGAKHTRWCARRRVSPGLSAPPAACRPCSRSSGKRPRSHRPAADSRRCRDPAPVTTYVMDPEEGPAPVSLRVGAPEASFHRRSAARARRGGSGRSIRSRSDGPGSPGRVHRRPGSESPAPR
jgi:hypothetical protein